MTVQIDALSAPAAGWWPGLVAVGAAFFVLKGLLGSESAAAKVPIGIRSDNDENLYENDHCSR